jgi:hypothetical protein
MIGNDVTLNQLPDAAFKFFLCKCKNRKQNPRKRKMRSPPSRKKINRTYTSRKRKWKTKKKWNPPAPLKKPKR